MGEMGAAVAEGGLGFASSLLEGIFSYYGMKEQASENAKINAMQLEESALDRDMRGSQFAATLGLSTRQQEQSEKQFKESLKLQKERLKEEKKAARYNKMTNFMNGIHESIYNAKAQPFKLIEVQKARF